VKFRIKQNTHKVYFCAFYCQSAGKEEKGKILLSFWCNLPKSSFLWKKVKVEKIGFSN